MVSLRNSSCRMTLINTYLLRKRHVGYGIIVSRKKDCWLFKRRKIEIVLEVDMNERSWSRKMYFVGRRIYSNKKNTNKNIISINFLSTDLIFKGHSNAAWLKQQVRFNSKTFIDLARMLNAISLACKLVRFIYRKCTDSCVPEMCSKSNWIILAVFAACITLSRSEVSSTFGRLINKKIFFK